MERKALGFEQLSDLNGSGVVIDSIAEYYKPRIGIVRTKSPFKYQARFKD